MTELARIQGEFQEYLLRGAPGIEAHVAGSARVPVETRLGIYAGAYGGRLIDALASNYPALAALLGEEDFRSLGAKYVATHDSLYFSIRHYGEALCRFLGEHPDYSEVPLLAELARWEWALSEVFDAADAEPLAPHALARVAAADWARLRFTWHPSIRRLSLRWNAPQLCQALTAGGERPELTVLATPLEWLAWRRSLESHFRSLEPLEGELLDAARSGSSFGELCERLSDAHGAQAAPAAAAALLQGWLGDGLIVAAAPA